MPLEHSPRELFPQTGLRGAKVLLRPFARTDITEQYLAWLRDPRVVRFSNQRLRRHDADTSLAYLASFEGTDNLFLSVRLLDDDRAIGTMTAYVARSHETADIGILIGDPAVWRQGLGLDAWGTLLDWLLQAAKLRKLTAGAVAANHGMVSVMAKSGMHHEATRRAQEIVEGQAQDIVYYARFRAA